MNGIEAISGNVAVHCNSCASPLCIRQQTVNLALGNDEVMFCLPCLAKESDCTREEVLDNIKSYILSRQCFRKEWVKYPDRTCCPQPDTCLPDACFAS